MHSSQIDSFCKPFYQTPLLRADFGPPGSGNLEARVLTGRWVEIVYRMAQSFSDGDHNYG
jgi:hypothetical protein